MAAPPPPRRDIAAMSTHIAPSRAEHVGGDETTHSTDTQLPLNRGGGSGGASGWTSGAVQSLLQMEWWESEYSSGTSIHMIRERTC